MTQILSKPDIEQQVSSFRLVPSDGGRFEFVVNGQSLFSKKELGRHAEPGEILLLLKNYMEK
jgi:selenoprotein W-related protein